MKKIYVLIAALVVAATSVQAQAPQFAKGDEVVSLGVGFGHNLVPIALSYEKGFMDINDKSTIGLGGKIAYQHKGAYNGCTLAVTGAYHYDLVNNFDLFADLSLGYTVGTVGDFYWGIGVGGRYYFNEKLGAYAKLGYTETSYFEVGATYRFNLSSLFKK